MMKSVAEFKMRVLQESLRVLSPNRRMFVTTAPLNSEMLQLIGFELLTRGFELVSRVLLFHAKVNFRCFPTIVAKVFLIE